MKTWLIMILHFNIMNFEEITMKEYGDWYNTLCVIFITVLVT